MGGVQTKNRKKLKVICVKVGNKYSLEYVYKLRSMFNRHCGDADTNFICYTDEEKIKGITTKYTNKQGWWGKVDIFNEKGPCLFFDLDTIIVDNISKFVSSIYNLKPSEFVMIKPWIQPGWASGIMAWNGNFSFISKEFKPYHTYEFKWDQRYIVSRLGEHSIIPVQNFVSICSYKHHCRAINRVPNGVSIVCFHGRPNPHEVGKTLWVKENWR